MKNPPKLTLATTLFLAIVWSVSASSQEKPAGPPTATQSGTDSELNRARDLLSRCTSVEARLLETVNILDHSFKAEGRYLQGMLSPNDYHLRMELTVKAGSNQGSLVEVCDGQILWTRHEIGKDTTVTRRNITQILEAARKRPDIAESTIVADLGLGGLPALLASLERSMNFAGHEKKTLGKRPVIVVQGTWKKEFVARWQAPPAAGTEAPPLPPFIPDHAQIYFDQESHFPVRILYLKKIPGREKLRPMLTLDFLDVKLNQPIDKEEFTFVPPDRPSPIEVTPMYLNQLLPQGAPQPAPGAAVPESPAPPK